jgi:lysophospholipase L1-like esterase
MQKQNRNYANSTTVLFNHVFLVMFVVFTAACSKSGQLDAASSNKAQLKAINIVALGDSTTDAEWEGNVPNVYADRLVGELQARGIESSVVNAGIRNTTSKQALARLDKDVRRHNPDFVIVQFGINDSWIDAYQGRTNPRLSLDEYTYYLTTIIDLLRGEGVQVILMTPNPMRWSEMYGDEMRNPALGFDFDDPRGFNRLLDIYAEQVRYLALKKDVPLIDVSANFEAYDQVDGQSIHELLIPGDEIHPSEAGHALIARWLAEELLALLEE